MFQNSTLVHFQVHLAFALACKVAPFPKLSNEHRIVENFRSESISLDEDDVTHLSSLDRNFRLFKWGLYTQGGQTLNAICGVQEDEAYRIFSIKPRAYYFFQGFYCCAYYTRARTDRGRALLFQLSASQLA